MGATQPYQRSEARSYALGRDVAVSCIALLCATLFCCLTGQAQVPVALVTNQSALNLSSQFGVPALNAVDTSGDVAMIGDGQSALFYRLAGAGAATRLLQNGSAVPGIAGSQITGFHGLEINTAAHISFGVAYTLADGLQHDAILTYDGETYRIIANSDSAAPNSSSKIYGLPLNLGGLDDNGDVSFTAPLTPLGPATQIPSTTLFISVAGGTPVRVAGIGDPVPGIASSAIGFFDSLIAFNNSGQELIEVNITPGTGTTLLLCSVSSGLGVVQEVVRNGDTAPASNGTFNSSVTTGALNNAGQVAFSASTSTGAKGTWLWTAGTVSAAVLAGASAPASLGGTLSNPTPVDIDTAGDILLTASVTGSAITTSALLRYHTSNSITDVVAYASEPAPGSGLSGQTFSSLNASMASDGTVSFFTGLSGGGSAIYQQTGTGTPALVVVNGASTPLAGGGAFSLLTNTAPQTLAGGLTHFAAYIVGGSAYFAHFLGTTSSTKALMSTADPLPAGAVVSVSSNAGSSDNPNVAFLAQQAGGSLSLFLTSISPFATIQLATEGMTAPGVSGPIAFSFPLAIPTGASPIFLSESGQVLLRARFAGGQAFFLASLSGLTKVVASGDPSPISGATFITPSVSDSSLPPLILNDEGYVAFYSTLSNGQDGIFLYDGGIAQIAVTGESISGLTGTISSFPSPNTYTALNQAGEVAFVAQMTGGTVTQGIFLGGIGFTPLKVAATGDSVPGVAGGTFDPSFSISSFNNVGDITFQDAYSVSASLGFGIFVGTPFAGTPVQKVALDGAGAPGAEGTFVTSHTQAFDGATFITEGADAAINDEGDVVFRAGINGSPTTNSGYFRILNYGPLAGIVQAIVFQGQPTPGGSGTFGTIAGAFTPGQAFSLGNNGQVAFTGTVVNGGVTTGGDFLVKPDGTIVKILAAGDQVPGTGGGVLSAAASSFATSSGNNDIFVFWTGATGGSANQAIMFTLPAAGVEPSSTTLASSLNPSISGQSVLFTTTTVSGSVNLTPQGYVGILDSGSLIAVGPVDGNGQASFSVTLLGVGAHSISAYYVGDNVFAPSGSARLTQTVTSPVSLNPTSTSLGSSLNPSTVGQSVTFTANVTSTAGGTPTGNVSFLDSGALIGTGTLDVNGQTTFTTSSLEQGPHAMTAQYSGDTSFASSTSFALLTQTVEPVPNSSAIFTVAGGGFSLANCPSNNCGNCQNNCGNNNCQNNCGGDIGNPIGVCAQNSFGGIFFGDYYLRSCNQIFKVTPDGFTTLIAGTGVAGYSGDGGPATAAELGGGNMGVFLDTSGNVYVADALNNRIRVVNMQSTAIIVQGVTIQPGNIQTVAGNGNPGYNGDSISALSAELFNPVAVVLDGSGNLYIADEDNERIRKVSGGTVTTVAGNGTLGFAGDGGLATAAELHSPQGVALDASGNIYIADTTNRRVRVVNTQATPITVQGVAGIPAGDIQTIAGTGASGYNGDNISAITAKLFDPNGVFVDSSLNVYIGDLNNERVRKLTSGTITTIAGNGTAGYTGDYQPATSAEIASPSAVYVAASGNIFFSTLSGVREVVAANGQIQTAVGNNAFGYGGDSIGETDPAIGAQMFYPNALAVDGFGNVFFADAGNYRVRELVAADGQQIVTIAGNGTAASSGDGGPVANASVEPSSGVAVDQFGHIFFSEHQFLGSVTNCRVREFTVGGSITTVAGIGTCTNSGDGGLATSAGLDETYGIAVDPAANLYIAQGGASPRIRVVNTNDNEENSNIVVAGVSIPPNDIQTVAGNGTIGFTGDGGPSTSAELNSPQGVFVDGMGNIFIADTGNSRVRVVNTQSTPITVAGVTIQPGTIKTVAGNGTNGFSGDGGPATSAAFVPVSVIVDGSGNIFIADNASRVREVSGATGIIQTFVGNGTRGFSGDGGPATSAELNDPTSLAFDPSGNLYLTDTANARIRFVGNSDPVPTIASLSPASQTAGHGAFTLTVNGSGFVPGAQVYFNGDGEQTVFVNAGKLTATINAFDVESGGVFQVFVDNPLGGGVSGGFPFTVSNPGITITSLSPNGTLAGGSQLLLTVNGTGFNSSSMVNFNGSPRATALVSSAQLTATIFASDIATTGTNYITVTNPPPGGGTSAPFVFAVSGASNPVPTLTSIGPTSAAIGQDLLLTLTGTNFISNSIVTVGGFQNAGGVASNGGATLTITIPGSEFTATGTMNVSVTNPAPGGGSTGAQSLTVNNPGPSLNFVNPTLIPAGSGDTALAIGGSGFVSGASVSAGGVSQGTTFFDSGDLAITLPAAELQSIGVSSVNVANPAPGGGSSGSLPIAVTGPTPPNDNFASATPVTSVPFTATEDTSSATTERTDPMTFCEDNPANSVWYKFTASSSGTLVVDALYSDVSEELTVITGAPGSFLVQGGTCSSSQVVLPVTGGTTYYFMLTAPSGTLPGVTAFDVNFTAAAPPNDDILNAINVATLPFQNVQDTTNATANTGTNPDPNPACVDSSTANANSIWYKFTPASSGPFTAFTNGSLFDVILSVWTGVPGDLSSVGCSDNAFGDERVDFTANAGTTYYIMISAADALGGTSIFRLTSPSAVAPPNDNFANAIDASSSLPFVDTEDTTNATNEDTDPTTTSTLPNYGATGGCFGGVLATNTIWYKFTAPQTGFVTADTIGSPFDVILSVWTGGPGNFSQVACGDDLLSSNSFDGRVVFAAQSGTTYFLMVGGFPDDIEGTPSTSIFHLNFFPFATTTNVVSSSNPSLAGQSIALTATVIGSGAGTPTGSVTFFDGEAILGSPVELNVAGQARLITPALTAGLHQITAQYGGDQNFGASASSTLNQVVNPNGTSVSLTSSVNPSTLGQLVTFTAKVTSPSEGTPTGLVTFLDSGETVIGFAFLDGTATAAMNTSSLSVGSHPITAQYAGDGIFAANTSNTVTQVVNPSSTATGVMSSLNPSTAGQSVTFTATVTSTTGGTILGTVTFFDGSQAISGSPVALNGAGQAQLSTSSLSAALHQITAQYNGAGNFAGSTSTVLNQLVNSVSTGAATVTELGSSANPSAAGQSVTFTATVIGLAGGTPTGNVTFLDGDTTLGSGALNGTGHATFNTSSIGGNPTLLVDTGAAGASSINSEAMFAPGSTTCGPQPSCQSNFQFLAGQFALSSGATLSSVQGWMIVNVGGSITVKVSPDNGGVPGTSVFSQNYPVSAQAAGWVVFPNFNVTLAAGTYWISFEPTSGSNFNGDMPMGAPSPLANYAYFASGNSGYVNFSTFPPVPTLGFRVSGTAGPSGLSVGSHTITAQYGGDSSFAGSTSSQLIQVVNSSLSATSTELGTSANPATAGQLVTLTATVTSTAGGTPTGTMTFFDGAQSLAPPVALAAGQALLATSSLAVGPHQITAQYSGDSNFAGSTSSALTQTISSLKVTSTALSSSANPSTLGQPVTITATVTSTAGGMPTGTVTFFDGVQALGSPAGLSNIAGQAQAILVTSSLALGSHQITAQYSGGPNFAASTSTTLTQMVNSLKSSSTGLTSSMNPSTVGQSVTFTATVTSTAGGAPTGTVTFFDGAQALGSPVGLSVAGQAQLSTSALVVGSHQITAQYSGDSNFTGSTSTVDTQVVNAMKSSSTGLTSSMNPSTVGQSVTFTAVVTSTSGGTPTGNVTFFDGVQALQSPVTLTIVAGQTQAQLATSSLAASSHQITAQYSGDSNFTGSTSTAVTQVVNNAGAAATTTGLISSANPSAVGQSVTFTATVSSVAPGTATGTVTFFDGNQALAGSPVALNGNRQAALAISSLGAGMHQITAQYNGDSNFAGSTSSPLSQSVVTLSSTVTTLASSANPAVSGQFVTFTATVTSTAQGTPTGNVTFSDGGVSLGVVPLVVLGQAQAQLTLSTLAAGPHQITAQFGGDSNFAGSGSNMLAEAVNNPVPVITSLSQTEATAGGTGFTLTVNGVFFTSNSAISFNGNPRATSILSATRLQATITTVDIATAGTFPVTVANPGPGGGMSNSISFTVSALTSGSPVTIQITPQPSNVAAGTSVQFMATVQNALSSGATWQLTGPGTLDSSGYYTAPLSPSASQVTITATALADSSKTATAQFTVAADALTSEEGPINVSSGGQLSSSAQLAGVPATSTVPFTLTVSNLPAGVTCSFTPPVVTGQNPNFVLSCSTTGASSAQLVPLSIPVEPNGLPYALFGLTLAACMFIWRGRRGGLAVKGFACLIVLLVVSAVFLSSCSGFTPTTTTTTTPPVTAVTPKGNFQAVVVATPPANSAFVQTQLQVPFTVN